MAAPAFGAVGTILAGGTRTSSAVPVPSGVTAGQAIIVYIYQAANNAAVTPPAGFAELTFANNFTTTGTVLGMRVFWKVASGADSGTYTFTHASMFTIGLAARYTGIAATGTPIESLGSAQTATASTTTPAVSGTTSTADELVCFVPVSLNTGAWTTATGYTENFDNSTAGFALDSKAQAVAGATGSATSTLSGGATSMVAVMFGLLSAQPAPLPPRIAVSNPALNRSFTR